MGLKYVLTEADREVLLRRALRHVAGAQKAINLLLGYEEFHNDNETQLDRGDTNRPAGLAGGVVPSDDRHDH